MTTHTPTHAAQSSDRLAVSPSEAARMAGVGRTKLYEAIGNGQLASFKIGTRRLVRVAAIEEWLATCETRARVAGASAPATPGRS